MNLKSLTPMAEYVDMLYTRLAIEMPQHHEVVRWWVELHPPPVAIGGAVGQVRLKALRDSHPKNLVVTYTASMHAIEQGAQVNAEVLETVVAHHIKGFVEGINDSGT